MEKKQVRIFSDYNDWPLWTDETGGTAPEDWPMLSPSLRESLLALEDYWERNFHYERGWIAGTEAWYQDETKRLARWLQHELGEDYEVVVG